MNIINKINYNYNCNCIMNKLYVGCDMSIDIMTFNKKN